MMKKVFSLLLIALLFSSCGIFRNVKKDKYEYDLKTSNKVDSNVKIEEKTLDRGTVRTVDKGQTVTERNIIKRIEVPGSNISIRANLLQLKNGETITLDSAGTKVSIMLDSLGQNLKIGIQAPDQSITETTNETITENKNQESEEQKDLSTEGKQQVAVSSESSRKESIEAGSVEREGKNSFWFVMLGLGVTFIVVWFVYRYIKKQK